MNIHLKEVLFVEMGGGEGGSQQFHQAHEYLEGGYLISPSSLPLQALFVGQIAKGWRQQI